jgi:hypothetical protein
VHKAEFYYAYEDATWCCKQGEARVSPFWHQLGGVL